MGLNFCNFHYVLRLFGNSNTIGPVVTAPAWVQTTRQYQPPNYMQEVLYQFVKTLSTLKRIFPLKNQHWVLFTSKT